MVVLVLVGLVMGQSGVRSRLCTDVAAPSREANRAAERASWRTKRPTIQAQISPGNPSVWYML